MTYGTFLRLLRKRKGLTLQNVAEAVGVKYPAVQQWETDKTVPQRDKLKNLSELLGANLRYVTPHPGSGIVIEYDEELLNYLVEEFDKSKELRVDGERRGRDPARYELHMKSIEDDRNNIDFYLKSNKKPGLYNVICVYRAQQISGTEQFTLASDIESYISKPPAISMIKFPFGIFMPNNSMSPKYDKGDLLLFDDVAVKEYTGYALVCTFKKKEMIFTNCSILKIASMNSHEIIAFRLNPIEHITLEITEETYVYRSLGLGDLVDDLTPKK